MDKTLREISEELSKSAQSANYTNDDGDFCIECFKEKIDQALSAIRELLHKEIDKENLHVCKINCIHQECRERRLFNAGLLSCHSAIDRVLGEGK